MGKKTRNTDRRSSARRKLIPAVAMMMTSAAMLTTSTYAWFTMSKEVSVSSIQLTASVPETLEISLGVKNSGEGNGISAAPVNENATGTWSNTVSFSSYYSNIIEKLTPASSINGLNIFYTGDAVGDGTSLNQKPQFTKAASSGTYYIDIPVWFRTSAKSETDDYVELAAKADITSGTAGAQIYKAVRVAVLDDNAVALADGDLSSKGVLMNSDASYINCSACDVTVETGKNLAIKAPKTSNDAITTSAGTAYYENFYGYVSKAVQYGDAVNPDTLIKVPKNTSGNVYGQMEKSIIRIWLEGEDEACYNPNAGQSFNVALTFYDKNQS